MKQLYYFLALGLMLGLSSCKHETLTASYEVIPTPREVTLNSQGGEFNLNGKTVIAYQAGNDTLRKDAEHLQSYLKLLTGHELKITDSTPDKNSINLQVGNGVTNPEGYQLIVTPEKIDINGATSAGVFYGIQTLRKSIPATDGGKYDVIFPSATITDYPRFAYRGAHFDVVRHFFPQDSVKKFIDVLALHNINRLHWHITDDQGWRVEIKKYPELTEIGSKRANTVIGHNTGEYDSIPVEGYFTQDEIKDIIQYAADRHITIIPEIDLPGHMQSVLAAYPNLGCTGGPYDVWNMWGVSEEVLCAGNDSIYVFLDNVLDEISDLFPSEYIHIGGDECPKVRWEECVKCQAKIKELGLKSDAEGTAEQKLQSHVMKHTENYLKSKGKKIIGWDEILEGGASESATIMSWQGEKGGIEAARRGNDVIMTPNTYLYFDYYQTRDVDNEPMAIGGYVPLSKVYSYEPIPDYFTPEEASHILGVQANLWTEYIKDFPQVLYMELPRMAALSEVQWSEGKKDYDDFMNRLPSLMSHYKSNDYNYSMRGFDIQGDQDVDTSDNTSLFKLSAPGSGTIYYTLDGSEPTTSSTKYEGPVKVSKDTRLKAIASYPFALSHVYKDSVSFNKATAHPVKLITSPSPNYSATPTVLTDGKRGGRNWKSGEWMGFYGTDAIIEIDLQQPEEISQVGANMNVDTGSYIFDVRKMIVSVSDDGENWQEVAQESYPALEANAGYIKEHTLSFPEVKTRYVKVELQPEPTIPSWHSGKGAKTFLFIDEISVN